MIFRVDEENRLYQILVEDEDAFLKVQEGGKIKFIKTNELPQTNKTGKVFYKLENDEIIIDEEKTNEYNIKNLKKEIEKRATNFVKNQLTELDYDNEGEVALYATNENSKWYDEAVALRQWIEDIYKKMYELQNNITVDNYKDIDLDEIETEFLKIKFINPNINANLNTNVNNITSPSLTK